MPRKGVQQLKGAALQEQKRLERALKKAHADAAMKEHPDAHLHNAAVRFHTTAARGHTPTLPAFHMFRDINSMGLSPADRALFQRYLDVSLEQDEIPLIMHNQGNSAHVEFWQDSTRSFILQCSDTARKNCILVYLNYFTEQLHKCTVLMAQGQGGNALPALFEWLHPRLPEAILDKWTPLIAQAMAGDVRYTHGLELLLAHVQEVMPRNSRSPDTPLSFDDYSVPVLDMDLFDFARVLSVIDEFSPEALAQAHKQALRSQCELDEMSPIRHVSQFPELERFLELGYYKKKRDTTVAMCAAEDPLYESFSKYTLVFFPLLLRHSVLPAAFLLYREILEQFRTKIRRYRKASDPPEMAQAYHIFDDPLCPAISMMRSGFIWNPFIRAFIQFDIGNPLYSTYSYWSQFAGKEDLPCPICFEPVSHTCFKACNACTKIVCFPCVQRHQRTHSLAAPHCPHCRAVF